MTPLGVRGTWQEGLGKLRDHVSGRAVDEAAVEGRECRETDLRREEGECG